MKNFTFDFSNRSYCLDRLELEIRESTISAELCCALFHEGNIDVYFETDLTEAEETTLQDIIDDHTAENPCPDTTCPWIANCPRFST